MAGITLLGARSRHRAERSVSHADTGCDGAATRKHTHWRASHGSKKKKEEQHRGAHAHAKSKQRARTTSPRFDESRREQLATLLLAHHSDERFTIARLTARSG